MAKLSVWDQWFQFWSNFNKLKLLDRQRNGSITLSIWNMIPSTCIRASTEAKTINNDVPSCGDTCEPSEISIQFTTIPVFSRSVVLLNTVIHQLQFWKQLNLIISVHHSQLASKLNIKKGLITKLSRQRAVREGSVKKNTRHTSWSISLEYCGKLNLHLFSASNYVETLQTWFTYCSSAAC